MSESNEPADDADDKDLPRTGMGAIVGEDFSPMAAMGGVRGIAEAVVPSLLFILTYVATKSLGPSLAASIGATVVLVAVRLVQRIDLTPALGGAAGVAVSALWAWRTGDAGDYFTLGLWTNGAYLAAFLVSIAVRWPLIGVLVAILRGEPQESWRAKGSSERRRYYAATWLWAGLFGLRLLVQLPLYLAHSVELLGLFRLLMGPFLFALVAWATWMLCRRPDDVIELG